MSEHTNVDWPIAKEPTGQEAGVGSRVEGGTDPKAGSFSLEEFWKEQVRLGKMTAEEVEGYRADRAARTAEDARRSAEVRKNIGSHKVVDGVTYTPSHRQAQGPDADEEHAKIIDLKELEKRSKQSESGKTGAWERIKAFFRG